MKKFLLFILVAIFYSAVAQPTFQVLFPNENGNLDGRLLLMLAKNDKSEPRFQIVDGHETQLVFGQNLETWSNKKAANISTPNTYGYPIESVKEVPKGEYYVQVLLHKYETFHRKDGKKVKLPMDREEGQQWNLAPGKV